MNHPFCQDSYGNFHLLSNNFPIIFGLNICIIRLFGPDLQPDQPKRAAYPVLQEEYNAACYCPVHGVCTHPRASISPRGLQFHRFRLHIFPYVKNLTHLIILKRCPMKKRLRLDPYQSAVIQFCSIRRKPQFFPEFPQC